MLNRTPIPRDQRPPLPDFEPVPRRRHRHDGWTPERQRAFIEALADTGSVSRAAHMVNMSPESAYQLRRQPGAEGFRRAWDAALDFGLARLKDEAFDRALNGYLVPVFTGGTLRGFRRKKNDRLLMFCLRHYGHDADGRRVTINYFQTNATANSSPGFPGGTAARHAGGMPEGGTGCEDSRRDHLPAANGGGASCGGATSGAATAIATAETTTHTLAAPTPAARDDAAAALINHFEPALLDDQAQAEIQAALAACAERRRTLDPCDDPDTAFVAANEAPPFAGALESGAESDDFIPYRDGELSWEGMLSPNRSIASRGAGHLDGHSLYGAPAAATADVKGFKPTANPTVNHRAGKVI